jgi:hypothetical protein
MTQAPFKFCPACGQKLALHVTHCARCYAAQPHTVGPFRPVTPQTDATSFTMPDNQPASGYVPFTPQTPFHAPPPDAAPVTPPFVVVNVSNDPYYNRYFLRNLELMREYPWIAPVIVAVVLGIMVFSAISTQITMQQEQRHYTDEMIHHIYGR